MQLYYLPSIDENTVVLNPDKAKHCIKVLKYRIGDNLFFTDGKGKLFKTVIVDDNLKACKIEIKEIIENYQPLNHYLHIAISPIKNLSRFEWFIEKATEIGISEITPLICQRTEKNHININRLTNIAIAAIEQSLKTTLPRINPAVKFEEFVVNNNNSLKLIAHCEDSEKIFINNIDKKIKNTIVMIGPEGDFSSNEIIFSKKHNFIPIILNNYRLRTETAAIVACNAINLLHQ